MKQLLAALLALSLPALACAAPPQPAYVTGSPTTGALGKSSGPQSFTTGDLSGDCTTSGTLAVTCTLKGVYVFSVPSNVTVANATIVADPRYAWTSGTITSVDYGTNGSSTPSFSASVKIGGTNVTGCNGLTVSSSTNTSATCTAANTLSAGSVITIVIASTSGSPNQAWIKINFTHSAN